MKRLCDLLLPQFQSLDEWEEILSQVKQCKEDEMSAYEVYLALAQEYFPIPLHIVEAIFEKTPCLVHDYETYTMNCLIAYLNEHTPFETIKYLLDNSSRSFELANALIRKSLRADFMRFEVARDLIRYDPGLLAYCDNEGNMPIHECCLHCDSPTMVQLLVEEGLIFTDEWLPRNSDGMSAIDIALESDNVDGARVVLGILIHSYLEFPTKLEVINNELLHVAARIGDLFFARHILDMYPECIHTRNKENATALHLACLHSIPTMIQFLLDKEVALKIPSAATMSHTGSMFSPVQIACANPYVNIHTMQSLLHASLDPFPLPTLVWRYRLLHITAMGTNVELARFFIDMFPQALVMTSNTGCLPIRLACISGSSEMVEVLLCKGMQLFGDRSGLMQHAEDIYVQTALQSACSNPRLSQRIVKRLFRATGVNACEVLDGNLLHRAVKCYNVDVARFILQNWPTSLHHMDEDRNLPLHLACSSESNEMICLVFNRSLRYLMLKKYQHWDALSRSIFQKNRFGHTPWQLMCESFRNNFDWSGDVAFSGGAWPCIKLIIYFKAGMLQIQPNGDLPLLHAAIAMIQQRDVLRAVLVNRALPCSFGIVDNRRKNVLHVAAEQAAHREGSWQDIIEYLIIFGNDENNGIHCACMRDDSGRLPIHSATANRLSWMNGLEDITEANFYALSIPDPVTNLYPFMLAAHGDAASSVPADLNSVYTLLRMNPEIIGNHSRLQDSTHP